MLEMNLGMDEGNKRINRIAYIRPASWPPANESVLISLQKQFPQAEIDVITIMEILKKQPAFLILNSLSAVFHYGGNILSQRIDLRRAFQRTTKFFDYTSHLIRERLSKKDYLFSFQIQSIFDGSLLGLPHFVYTDHTHLANLLYPSFDRRKLLPESWIQREIAIYENARIVFTRSSHITNSVISQYNIPAEKVKCVYYGANVPNHSELDPDRYARKNILFVGINWQRKGGDDLLKAFELVLNTHFDATLTIVGSSPVVNLPNVKLIGRVPIEEMNKYYEQASIFCLPTTLEPSAVAYIEAQSFRLPLVVTNIGAAPDLIVNGENGYLVDVHNPTQLAIALIRLLDDPHLCEQMGNAGYERTHEIYNWDSVAKRMKAQILASL